MTETPHLIIGTRGSDLALWQAHHTRDRILELGGTVEIRVLSTQGDREQVQSFEKLEGKGFFTKEIEEALLDGRIDVAVHSHKDLETRQPQGLAVIAVPHRASPRDVLLVREDRLAAAPWLPLSDSAVVGTSSVRRRDQLQLLRPDVRVAALRGNVPTRIERLRAGHYDAIVLAEAGLDRLNLSLEGLHRHVLHPRCFVPAPAQGALALQMRADDPRRTFIARLGDPETTAAVAHERTVLQSLEGGCQLPFGAQWDAHTGMLRCFLQSPAGPRRTLSRSPEEALDALRSTNGAAPLTVRITRTPRPDSLLGRLCSAHGIRLIESPAVVIEPLPAPIIPEPSAPFDWVWIGSPGAAAAAADWSNRHPTARIAVPGDGTAEALPAAWHPRLGYVGQGTPQQAWAVFAEQRTEGEHIALPHSTASMQRWNAHPTRASVHAWPHYQTIPTTASKPTMEADIVCFTSPSNVHAWAGAPPTHAVAIGHTTAAALHERQWAHNTADAADAFGILEAILTR